MGKSLSKWHLPHGAIVRIQCVCVYTCSASHARQCTAALRSPAHWELRHSSPCSCHLPSAPGSTQTTPVWVLSVSPPCLHAQGALLFFCHFDAISDLGLGHISASLFQSPSALTPVRITTEIISEKARPNFVCTCLCMFGSADCVYMVMHSHAWVL